MNYFERRTRIKQIKHALHEARHARRMREDIARPEDVAQLERTEKELRNDLRTKQYEAALERIFRIEKEIRAIMPIPSAPRLRENLEVLVVAIAVAMAIRAYFFQPFKIPTGSMQPTLYGITVEQLKNGEKPGLWDGFPQKIIPFLINGTYYREVRAQAAGVVRTTGLDPTQTFVYVSIAGRQHAIRKGMRPHFREGEMVQRGAVLASGRFRFGDHLFVDKISYNFRRPRRGDVFVFQTGGIDHPRIRENTFYIKRLVGLPNEAIQIRPPFIHVNEEAWDQPHVTRFMDRKWPGDRQEYYGGYTNVSDNEARLRRPTDVLRLAEDEYLPFGDNTGSSLDGRYFGGVNQEDIVGPAFVVYWPFNRRWGRIR